MAQFSQARRARLAHDAAVARDRARFMAIVRAQEAARPTCQHPAENCHYAAVADVTVCNTCGARLRDGQVIY